MATRINLLPLDHVSRSSEYPLLRNSEKYSNFQTPSRLANNQFWHGWSTVHWASIRWAQTYASVPIVGQSKTNPRLVPKYLPVVMFEFLNRRTILKVPHWNLKHSSHRFGCPTACYKSGFSSNSVSTEAVWSLARAKIPSSDDTRHHGCFCCCCWKKYSFVKWIALSQRNHRTVISTVQKTDKRDCNSDTFQVFRVIIVGFRSISLDAPVWEITLNISTQLEARKQSTDDFNDGIFPGLSTEKCVQMAEKVQRPFHMNFFCSHDNVSCWRMKNRIVFHTLVNTFDCVSNSIQTASVLTEFDENPDL